MSVIDCPIHGKNAEAFVCQHIAAGLLDNQRVGFFWTGSEADNPHPDAWCAGCEARRLEHNGEWEGEAANQLQAKIMCGSCYDVAKTFHLGGKPWS
jgi:hypothetical protein